MDLPLRNRRFSENDLTLIRTMVERHWSRGRRFIGEELCRQWQWVYADGTVKMVACLEALRRLEAKGLIRLPPRRGGSTKPKGPWRDSQQLSLSLEALPEAGSDSVLERVHWRLTNSPALSGLYRDLVQAHHYLGYRHVIGQSLRYIAYQGERPIACLGWGAAAWKVAARDQWIGWSAAARHKNLSRLINNTRFLVLERRPHLASHLLGANIRRLAQDWQDHYGYRPLLLETFVDTTRFAGTCYKAANWTCVGLTQGRGKYDRQSRHPETIKAVFVYALGRNACEELCRE